MLLTDRLGYLDFLALETHAGLLLTDSGGIQEETTYLGVPCLTRRSTRERPVTVEKGTNQLIPLSRRLIVAEAREALSSGNQVKQCADLWDGCAASRILGVLGGSERYLR